MDLKPSTPSPRWELWSWKDEKHYYQTTTPASEITFSIDVRPGGEGTVAISYLRSKMYDLGRVTCRVGKQSRSVDGHWERSVSVAQYVVASLTRSLRRVRLTRCFSSNRRTAIIAERLPPGTHELRCRTPDRPVKGRNVFRLIGVLSR